MGLLVGVVTTTNRQPICDARVMVVSGPKHPDIAGLTNEEGRFRLGGLEPGNYRIEVDAEGFLPAHGGVRVLTKGARLYRIALQPNVLDGDDGAYVPELD